MASDLANTRHGIPRGGLKRPTTLASNSPMSSEVRPAARRGCPDNSPST